ncbi:MAG: hypothetical protein MJE63_02885 [Proteobacteria bacterium]|nr:hypothetical protein [Pseudomonadota bacterium]
MNPAKVLCTLIMLMLTMTLSLPAYSVTFMGVDDKGARYFKCGFSCGKFKVIRKARNTYRIYSIYFSGEIKAGSFIEAAEFACKESDGSMRKLTDPKPSRSGSNC